MVVGLFGILKAGGAYLPLEPGSPKERLAFMLQDAHPQLLLTQQRLLPQLPEVAQPIVCLDRDWASIAGESEQKPVSGVTGQNLAYVIYTSGSTGKPKGAMILHRGLLNYLNWCSQAYEATAGTGSPLHSPLGFDLTVTSLFSPLVAGQAITLVTEEQGAEGLASALHTGTDYSLVKLTPAHVQLLSQTLRPEEAATSTRALVIGGEALLAEQLAFWRQHAPATRLINEYGPTETVVGCCVYEVAPQDPASGAVPIGQPIANTQLYVLDAQLQLAPIGVAGELYIGGAGLARGYLNRPELTAERFVAHPWSAEPGARLYKTGDLARYRADGVLEFLGRLDHQVKVRGYRIELGEIEQALLEHPAVREGIVVVREDGLDNKQLVAYVVAVQNQEPVGEWQATLRAYLGERLPDYMVPSHFVVLEALPLTSNGKVDRCALPDPHLRAEQGLHHPQGPIEELLAGIWQELLHVPVISSHDHFFALGGHSLLAMQVVARIRQQLGLELPLRTLFEAPTLAALSQHVQQQLRAEPQDLLPPLLPAAHSTPPPLSFAQERLWFLEQLEPGQPTYHVPLILHLHGPLDPAALQASWHLLEARHEGLRLHIALHEGQAVQGLLPVGCSPLLHLDLSSLSPQQRERELRRLAREEIHRPFDLVTGPLWRLRLLRLEAEDWVLLLTMHHIIPDGWSRQVLLHELSQAYLARQRGRTLSLPALPIQYADYALWQRQWLQGARLEAQLAYWRERLAGLEPLQLPTDHPRPSVQSSRGAQQVLHLSASLQQQLQALSRQEGVTLFMTLLAGWLLVLQRYSGQSDIAVGTPIANRSQAELEGLLGFFVNTLVLRCQLEGQANLRQLLAQVREVTLGAYSHQEVPFERVVEALQPERELNRSPLFQVMFAGQQEVLPQQSWEGITLQGEDPELDVAKFDLTLEVAESEQGIEAVLEYNTDLFEPATVKRMLAHWQQALQALVQQPDQRVADVSLLTEAERALLLDTWNTTQRAYPQEVCVHELFEQQAANHPDAIALVQEEAHLTYGELDRRANQLAHSLRQLGVGPDVLVGLGVERWLEMVVALLGILNAGGAYLPLDPAYPQERLAFVLQDAQTLLLLTQQRLLPKLPPTAQGVVCLDRDWQSIAGQSEQKPLSGVTAENLAYVIYTSGSTGKPKGVLVNHANVVRLFRATLDWFHFDKRDVWTLFHSYAFDFSVWELWGALLYGGRLVVVSYWMSRSPESFYNLLCSEQVTVLNQTPSAFRQLIQAEQALEIQRNLALRLVIFGGEALEFQSLKPWFHLHGDLSPQLVNMYGITETTVHVTYYPLTAANLSLTSGSVIGGPIPDLQTYILDQYLQLVPIGASGELYVGGAGLARGYLNRPELTAERFIPHPFSGKPGLRLYKTGDQARYLPNGTIEYLGRIDHQVKIRGHRIELGEIEQGLVQYPTVRECVVVTRQSQAGSQQLVAYMVLVQPQQAAEEQAGLRRFLGERLPEYMVPSHFILLEALPLTSNGKVDRRALPAPEQVALHPGQQEDTAPRTSIEQTLTEIWSQVLHLPQVGIHDNFFALGGDSILSLSLIAQARRAGLQLTVKQLFQAPTIAQLSQLVTPLGAPAGSLEQERASSQGALALTPIQRWFFEQPLLNPHHWNQAFLLHAPAELSVARLEQAVQWVLGQHDVFRLRFVPPASPTEDWQASYVPTYEPVPFSLVDLRELPEEEQVSRLRDLCSQEQARLHLQSGPLARAVLFRLTGEQPWRLLLLSHHLVIDTVSWRILLEDLSEAYECLQQGLPLQPQAASSSFQQWAQRLQDYVHSQAMQQEADFWLRHPLPAAPDPLVEPAGANTEDGVQSIEQHRGLEETRALLREVPQRTRASVEEVLLTALALACSDCFGIPALAIALEEHGRKALFADVDLSRTVGWFTSLFPLVLEVGSQPEPLEALRTTRSRLRRLPQRGIGYGLLRYLHPDVEIRQRLQEQGQPAVSFNYLGQFDQVLGGEALFAPAPEDTGWHHAPENQRAHQLDVVALIVGEQLQLSLQYSGQQHSAESMQQLAEAYVARLQQLIAQASQAERCLAIPEDFPLLRLSQEGLDRLLAQAAGCAPRLAEGTRALLEDLYPLAGMQAGLLFHSQASF